MIKKRHLAIMVKEPRMGAVKSRLASGLGLVAATAFYRQLSSRLIRALALDPRWQVSLWVAPNRAVHSAKIWPMGIPRFDQGHGDIGARMRRAFQGLPKGDVVLVGSDIPDLGSAQVAAAFRALGSASVVFGPANDGGFWLIGISALRRGIDPFGQNIRWSSRFALSDSCDHIRAHIRDCGIARLAPLDDIDTLQDYKRWKSKKTRSRSK